MTAEQAVFVESWESVENYLTRFPRAHSLISLLKSRYASHFRAGFALEDFILSRAKKHGMQTGCSYIRGHAQPDLVRAWHEDAKRGGVVDHSWVSFQFTHLIITTNRRNGLEFIMELAVQDGDDALKAKCEHLIAETDVLLMAESVEVLWYISGEVGSFHNPLDVCSQQLEDILALLMVEPIQ